MKKTLLLILTMVFAALSAHAERETYHIAVSRPLSYSTTKATTFNARLNYLAVRFGCFDANDMTLSALGAYQMVAEVWGTNQVFATFTNGTGHWFCADGTPAESTADNNRCVAVKVDNGQMSITHRSRSCQVGDELWFAELFIHSADTVRYEFHVTIVDDDEPETVTTDLPENDFFHQEDQNDGLGITALLQKNDETPLQQNWIQVNVGDRITIDALVTDTAAYDSLQIRINDKEGVKMRDYENAAFVITESATVDMCGQYTMRCKRFKKGTSSSSTTSYIFYIDVQENAGKPLSWEGMIPEFGYDFHDEYGDIPEPQDILGDVASTEYGRMSDGWWTVAWGKNLNPAVGVDPDTNEDVHHAMQNMLDKYNEDFAFIRDEMGWPPDLRAREGYKSTILVYGSGLNSDNADSTATGGWQGATYYQGRSWPCVLASYYPVSRFRDDADKLWSDGDYQREAMIHEGIHCIFADMDGVKNSAWFHEAGNTWLQSAMAVRRTGDYGTPGYLDGCPFLAPFMPIECYSGWLQDGSFGGPSAEGVNMYTSSGQQICTWRTYLGGNQYGNSFPIILSEICGDGSIAWIWRYCSNRVLEGIGDYIGDEMMRKLIMQYRARQAIFDIGGWMTGYRQVTSDYFGQLFGPEWEPYYIDCGTWRATCYQRMRMNDNYGWMAPDEETTPGWSGANIIPIHVNTDSSTVRVQFRPEDTEERAMLCYKTKSGTAYYSQMVHCGDMVIDITDTPANGVIMCVVANTDYIYTGEDQRKHHWDYRIRLCEGALGIADKDKKWFMNEQTIEDDNWQDVSPVEDILDDSSPEERLKGHLQMLTGMVQAGGEIRLQVSGDIDPTDVNVRIVGIEGVVASQGHLTSSATYRLPSSLHHGLYVMSFTYGTEQLAYKVIVR